MTSTQSETVEHTRALIWNTWRLVLRRLADEDLHITLVVSKKKGAGTTDIAYRKGRVPAEVLEVTELCRTHLVLHSAGVVLILCLLAA